ncbi:hypothetical protein FGE12_03470 [Aggregicoccus sp. 17bor-14]|uniref:hypothetical protein n=1 Tax=Myxococcaceae TaxID=31 RepID=UPI00129C8159|nr:MULTISPECIES: hypothetical protein [Myxococcaceae]MBF5041432.1 hypothetical protein [Simulacricoccus sp. 17bor-14]MRI87216.1 hypothetical protein [Aggregicoccus sp. 17bor-14]
MKRLTFAAAALLLAAPACYTKTPDAAAAGVSSFRVEIKGLYPASAAAAADGTRAPLPVEVTCAAQYGNDQTQVPADKRGTEGCRYVIPHGSVDVALAITALDADGQRFTGFSGPVAFRVVPGDLTDANTTRWAQVTEGLATGTVRVSHVYGEVRIWVEDAPIAVDYVDGGVRLDMDGGVEVAGQLPPESNVAHTYVSGVSPAVLFDEPSLAAVQQPDGFDNKSSPFVGQFVKIGRAPEAGAPLLHHCLPGDPNDGQPMTLVVTGTDPSGFYVTDVTSCRIPEVRSGSSIMLEPSGFFPGTYGAMFVYNYNYPEGLDRGDLLWTLSGSVAEFSGATQMSFPAWTVRDHVRQTEKDPSKWEKYIPAPVELNLRTCAVSNVFAPFVTDELCGYSNANVKIESLESALVQLKGVKLPEVMVSCDKNGDGQVPFFCQTKDANGQWLWGECPGGALSANDTAERTCNADCTSGHGQFEGKVCAEKTTYNSFGQFVVEMAGPGPAAAHLDDSVPARLPSTAVTAGTPARTTTFWPAGSQLRVWCNVPVHVAFGQSAVTATVDDALLEANTRLEHLVDSSGGYVSFLADGTTAADSACWVGANSHTRISVLTRDAAPELKPDCDDSGSTAEAANCRALRAATYDITGHLKQIQAGRPRWLVTPRDVDDICCYPGKGLSCPKSIKACP